MTEIWRDIAGYNGLYQVSNRGRVRSFKSGEPRILKQNLNFYGYLCVQLWRDNKPKTCKIHRLVAQAFIPNPDGKPEVNHINGIKTDNRAENLEWATRLENEHHARTTGLTKQNGEDGSKAKLTNEQARFIRENPDGLNTYELARMFGVAQCTVSDVQRGRVYKNAGGNVRDKIKRRVPDDIREQICAEYNPHKHGYGSRALAKKYGVNSKTILKIIHEN